MDGLRVGEPSFFDPESLAGAWRQGFGALPECSSDASRGLKKSRPRKQRGRREVRAPKGAPPWAYSRSKIPVLPSPVRVTVFAR